MNNCKYCKADCALRGEENLKECKGHIPMSNADRIRAMSDEELAVFLSRDLKEPCDYCQNCGAMMNLEEKNGKSKNDRLFQARNAE